MSKNQILILKYMYVSHRKGVGGAGGGVLAGQLEQTRTCLPIILIRNRDQ